MEESQQSSATDEGQEQEESMSGSELDVPPIDDQHIDLSKNLECSYCNRVFTTRRQLLVHQWTHKERQEYVCQVCDKPISNENAFRKHMVMHFKDYSRHVRCKICQKVFRTPRAMEEHHEKYHRGQKPFVCTTCGLSFSWRDNLFKHERVHVEKPFACLVCHESFRDVAALNQHIKQHRRAQKSNDTKVMLMPKQQELHYKPLLSTNGSQPENDDNDDKEFKCEVCGMSFMYSFTLEAHMKGHAGNKVPQASVSVDPTKKKSNSKAVDKPHICPMCGEKFRWDFCLSAHLKIHQQKKVGGLVYFGSNRVPKPVDAVVESTRYKNIPSSKKLLMLVNNTQVKDNKGKLFTSTTSTGGPSVSAREQKSQFSPTSIPRSLASPMPSIPALPNFQARETSEKMAVDDLEPGEIRLDHLIDMAVDEDNWEPMVPKPDPVPMPVQDTDAAKAKKKARMIRVEQVPLEGRKKTTVVKNLGEVENSDESDKDEPVVTSMVAAKSKRGRPRNETPLVPSVQVDLDPEPDEAPEMEYEDMNFTESESDSGSDFENELKGRSKKKRKPILKKKIKTEKVEDDDFGCPPVKSRRGRPRKDSMGSQQGSKAQKIQDEEVELVRVQKRRPTRNSQPEPEAEKPVETSTPPSGRRRGRPPKIKEEKLDVEVSNMSPPVSELGRTTRNSLNNRKARMEIDAQSQLPVKEDSEEEGQVVPSMSKRRAQSMKPETFAKVSKLKVYSCDLCKKAFTKRTALLAHRLFAHKGVKRSALQHTGMEMIQHRALLNKADQLIRRASIRQSQVRPYECMECGKTFSQQAYLTFHEESHDNISRTYTCHQCDLTMYSWLQCIQHQMLHRKSAR